MVSFSNFRKAGRERYRGRETVDMERADVASDTAGSGEERGRSMLIRAG